MGLYTAPFSFSQHSLNDTLIDLGVRFVVNCPPEDISTAVRLFFQLEEAHWFYEDFAREQNQALPSLKMKGFVSQLYRAMPLMDRVCADPNAALAEFQNYKRSIPVRGAILVNEKLDKVLMVKSWKGASWGFPKGKINKEEDDAVCAVREVLEETGYDMSSLIDRSEYIESTYGGKNIRLYVVFGVPEKTHFETQTRKEISKIDWIPTNNLPAFNRKPKGNLSFYMVTPFMNGLKSYIARRKGYATKLSESESGALKNMLGISSESSEDVHNDEATAQHLLAMLHNGSHSSEQTQAAIPLQQTEGALSDSSGNQDRDILLNLLKRGTPEPTTKHESAEKNHAEVEGTKEILALLQHEMATERTVSAPPTIQPLENQADMSTRPAKAPALPPMGLLESLVLSRKANPIRKEFSRNPNEHRSTAPSKNSLLNLLNRPKQTESAKLMALLKPAKPTQSAPKRSPLMSLLESKQKGNSQEQSEQESTDSLQAPRKSKTDDINFDNDDSLVTSDAPSSNISSQRQPSSLLGLLKPDPSVNPVQATLVDVAVPTASTAVAVTGGKASPDRASSPPADPQPISPMSSAPALDADAKFMQQGFKRSDVVKSGKPREASPLSHNNVAGDLSNVHQISSASTPSGVPIGNITVNQKAASDANNKADTSSVENSSFNTFLPKFDSDLTASKTPQLIDSSATQSRQCDNLSAVPVSDPKVSEPHSRVSSRSDSTSAVEPLLSKKDQVTASKNPLLKLLEPTTRKTSDQVPESTETLKSPRNLESKALMSLLTTGSEASSGAGPASLPAGGSTESSSQVLEPKIESQDQNSSDNHVLAPEKKADLQAQTGSSKHAHVHLLKLLNQT